jgi:hypothetical protein
MESPKPPTLEQKFDLILDRLEKIEHTINPPLWKKLLQWAYQHFFTLILLFGILWGLWQIWEIVQSITAVTDSFKGEIGNVKTGIREGLESLKFWK